MKWQHSAMQRFQNHNAVQPQPKKTEDGDEYTPGRGYMDLLCGIYFFLSQRVEIHFFVN